jgi:hypothetical protein
MGYFAKIENGIVTNVIVADQEFINSNLIEGTWLETDANAYGGVVYDEQHNPTNATCLRKNYAGIGYSYDSILDAFIPPSPFPSWTLDTNTCLWIPPIAYPTNGDFYNWDENSKNWVVTKKIGVTSA